MAVETQNGSWAGSLDAWKRRGEHRVTLPSGMRVVMRIPDVGKLVQLESLPQELRRAAAMGAIAPGEAVREMISAIAQDDIGKTAELMARVEEVNKRLVLESVVEPQFSEADVDEIPNEDLELLVDIATRRAVEDAAGVRIGVAPLSDWDGFREAHGCAEDCVHCEELRARVSSVDVGAV